MPPPREGIAISNTAALAASVSILASTWMGLALLMAVRTGRALPVPSSQRVRVGIGLLTFFLWYAGMLLGMSVLAMLTVRSVPQVLPTALELSLLVAFLWGLRRLCRRVLVPPLRGLGAGPVERS